MRHYKENDNLLTKVYMGTPDHVSCTLWITIDHYMVFAMLTKQPYSCSLGDKALARITK
jgi:hypothetical protein